MSALNIPAEFQSILHDLALLSEDDFQKIKSTIEGSVAELRFDEKLVESTENIRISITGDIKELIKCLMTLSAVRASNEVSVREFVNDVYDGLDADTLKNECQKLETFGETLKFRLTEILRIKSLKNSSKAGYLALDYEIIFQDAHITTDIRPVFEDEPPLVAESAIISHTLRLSCIREGELENFYVALDSNDLEILNNVIQRAQDKANFLQKILKKANVHYIADQKISTNDANKMVEEDEPETGSIIIGEKQ